MTEKPHKVGPQGTKVFDASEVESILAKGLSQLQNNHAGQPALVGVSAPFTGIQYILDKTKHQIGRSQQSDIQLNESSVSLAHAQIVLRENQWKVINLLSSNGTYVNGKKVSEASISPGDRLRLGGVELMFVYLDTFAPENDFIGGISLGTKIALAGLVLVGAIAATAYFFLF